LLLGKVGGQNDPPATGDTIFLIANAGADNGRGERGEPLAAALELRWQLTAKHRSEKTRDRRFAVRSNRTMLSSQEACR
jgi:hypothetical protein